MYANWQDFLINIILRNFSMAMFILAVIFMILNKKISRNVRDSEIVYRWLAFFALGITSLYTFVMHAFFPMLSAKAIGWHTSPFQYEVAMANLAIGVIALLSYKASYGFRLATVIASTFWLWGDATGHIYQMILHRNFTIGNAGSWFVTDIILPLTLLISVIKLRKQ